MKKMFLIALGLVAACETQRPPAETTKATGDKPAAPTQATGDRPGEGGRPPAGTARPDPALNAQPGGEAAGTPGADPENGDFTLEEATAGLPPGKKLVAKITTEQGVITCELFPDKAPKTVASFVGLARGVRPFKDPKTGTWVKRPFFDGLAFHRVIPDFMIQGGDPLSTQYARPDIGTGDPGYELPDEIAPDMKFDVPGRLAMANAGPNTAGSQFFITESSKRTYLNGKYTIFGQCGGQDVVKQIARVPVDHPSRNKPLTPVTMKVEITRQ